MARSPLAMSSARPRRPPANETMAPQAAKRSATQSASSPTRVTGFARHEGAAALARLLRLGVSPRRLVPHAGHDHLELLFCLRALVRIPCRGMAVQLADLLQHLIDEGAQAELRAAIVYRLLRFLFVGHARAPRRVGGLRIPAGI